VFGIAVQDLLGREELALLDAPVARWIAAHTTPELTTIADAIVTVFSPPVGAWIVIAAGIVAWRLGGRAAGDRLVLAIALAVVIAEGLRILLPATLTGVRFPSLAVTGTAAAVAGVSVVVAAHGWRRGATVAGAGAMLVSIVAVADMVAGRSALSGVVGGAGLGTLLVVLVEFTWRTLQPAPEHRRAPADTDTTKQEA
jgi:undecaprenyl-diphosphatase